MGSVPALRVMPVGSTLSRVAITAFVRAAREMKDRGTFTFGEDALPFREINALFGG